MKKACYVLTVYCVLFSCKKEKDSQGENFNKNINKVAETIEDESDKLTFFNNPIHPITPKFQMLPTGSNKPKGWILQMMKTDLETGVVGALDGLYPGIQKDNLYNTQRRGGVMDVPEMGDLVLKGEEWEQSIMWWNAETTGNWWDGFIRHAFLTENEGAIKQSKAIVDNLLASQDDDGYIGIYKPNLRYQHQGSNGELWSQTTAFRALLAYYEFTGDPKVLQAVEKAMGITMKMYGPLGKNPFDLKNEFGGVTHGLMLTDVCETLYRITGTKDYQKYATYLYQSFSTYPLNRAFNDMRYSFLMEKDSLFQGHGAHVYEHMRPLINAYYNTGYPELEQAFNNALYKLDKCVLPSGAAHGNEWIAKMEANPDKTGTEFCTMLELRNSYASFIQKTGDITYADRAEKLTYNAMLGSRNQDGTAIVYGKLDNCYVLDGKRHEDGYEADDSRFKYSPTHSEPAVCCVPNYARNFSYFLDEMWMKSQDGLVAVMYGPSELTATVNGSSVKILQQTNYPLAEDINFNITLEHPSKFTLSFRKPQWSSKLLLEVNNATIEEDGNYYHVTKNWKTNDQLTVTFVYEIEQLEASNGEFYFQRGPLVYAYSIPAKEKVIKTYPNTKFKDYYCFPEEKRYKDLFLTNASNFQFVSENENSASWYDHKTYLLGTMENENKQQPIKLVPMGETVLRKITFPKR